MNETTATDGALEPESRRIGGSLSTRVILALVVVYVVSLLGAAFLNFTKFEQTYVGFAKERYDTVLRDLRGDLEDSLGIGLSLAATQSTQVITERLVDQYDSQFSVLIVDPDGMPLFQAGNPDDLGPLDPTELDAQIDFDEMKIVLERDDVYRGGNEERLINGTEVLNPFGELEGYILIDYDAEQVYQTVDDLASLLWRGVVVLGVIFMVVLSIAIYLLIRPIERGFVRDQRAFDYLMDSQRPEEPREDPVHVEETGYAHAREVDIEIAEIERRLARA